jgi:hypothetical protein
MLAQRATSAAAGRCTINTVRVQSKCKTVAAVYRSTVTFDSVLYTCTGVLLLVVNTTASAAAVAAAV